VKYALITGAGGGLGGACAQAFVAAGWAVFATDLAAPDIDGTTPLAMDVTNQHSIDAAIATIGKMTDTLDVVVNLAGVHTMGSLIEGDIAATMEKLIDVNLMGMVRVNRATIDLILNGHGRIINCSSECGYLKAQPFNGPYTISKYAVEAYTDSLHRELLGLDIKVIKIQPGSFKTGMHNSTLQGFEWLQSSTSHHQKALQKMQPLMTRELEHANDPAVLAQVVLKAAESPRPKSNYRVRNSGLLRLMQLVPNPLLDVVYRWMMR